MPRLIEDIKKLLKQSSLYTPYQAYRWNKTYDIWIRSGCPSPPPYVVKQRTIKEYRQKHGFKIMVETGTSLGDMVNAMKKDFEEIYSIELSSNLYQNARRRFEKLSHITILQGDSGKVLKALLPKIHRPTLFWLDAHFSEGLTARGDLETPIIQELVHIASHQLAHQHVILIDDARCFSGENDYPTIEQIQNFVAQYEFNSFEVKHDIIRIGTQQA